MRHRQPGQALLLVALCLPVICGLWLLAIELAWRFTTTQAVTDALRSANRSAVQTFDYAAFADNQLALASPANVIAIARQLARTNLTGIPGLLLSPTEIANTITWQVAPAGSTCTLASAAPALQLPTPALCGAADVQLISPLGMTISIHVDTADTLDTSSTP
jgi:Flp pilus assembly protein TadG